MWILRHSCLLFATIETNLALALSLYVRRRTGCQPFATYEIGSQVGKSFVLELNLQTVDSVCKIVRQIKLDGMIG